LTKHRTTFRRQHGCERRSVASRCEAVERRRRPGGTARPRDDLHAPCEHRGPGQSIHAGQRSGPRSDCSGARRPVRSVAEGTVGRGVALCGLRPVHRESRGPHRGATSGRSGPSVLPRDQASRLPDSMPDPGSPPPRTSEGWRRGSERLRRAVGGRPWISGNRAHAIPVRVGLCEAGGTGSGRGGRSASASVTLATGRAEGRSPACRSGPGKRCRSRDGAP